MRADIVKTTEEVMKEIKDSWARNPNENSRRQAMAGYIKSIKSKEDICITCVTYDGLSSCALVRGEGSCEVRGLGMKLEGGIYKITTLERVGKQ